MVFGGDEAGESRTPELPLPRARELRGCSRRLDGARLARWRGRRRPRSCCCTWHDAAVDAAARQGRRPAPAVRCCRCWSPRPPPTRRATCARCGGCCGCSRAIGARSAYLALLLHNARARARLVRLATHGDFLIDQIAAHPLLLDELIDERMLEQPPDRAVAGRRSGAAHGRRRRAATRSS